MAVCKLDETGDSETPPPVSSVAAISLSRGAPAPAMASTWNIWGESNVRQVELYSSMRWGELEGGLAAHVVAAAPFGGPIALTRDTSKLVMRSIMGGSDDDITVYSAAGECLCRIDRFDEGGRLVHMGWSSREFLFCVYEGGQVKVCVRATRCWRLRCARARARAERRLYFLLSPSHSPLPLFLFLSARQVHCAGRGERRVL